MHLRSAAARLRARLPRRLPWEPWSVLVPLVLAEWVSVVLVTQRAKHNGWLYYHGGEQTSYFTTSWIFGRGHIPHTVVGYGLPLLLAPITWITGPDFAAALHVILPLQLVLLLPVGALGAYALGARSGGRLIGYTAALVWTLAPIASIDYFANHPRWIDQILPSMLGLTEGSELPGTITLLLAGVLVLRALDERRLVDAAGAGVAAGFALAIKPSNFLFLAAPVVAFACARRARQLGAFAAGLAPCLLTLLLWRLRGLGHVGSWSQALLLPDPVHFSRLTLENNFSYLQAVSWSPRFLEWIAVAGFVGLFKRSPVKALFFGTWLVMYVLAEGVSRTTNGDHVSFWQVLMPAFPAYCVLMASLPLLWPRADRRLTERFAYRPRRLVPVALPALVFLLVPLAAVAAASPLHNRHDAATIQLNNVFVPIDRGVRLNGRVGSGSVTLAWEPTEELPAKSLYAVYRAPTHGSLAEGVQCTKRRSAATDCVLAMQRVATTPQTTWSDTPPKGEFTYRVAAVATFANTKVLGVPIFVSPPIDVSVR